MLRVAPARAADRSIARGLETSFPASPGISNNSRERNAGLFGKRRAAHVCDQISKVARSRSGRYESTSVHRECECVLCRDLGSELVYVSVLTWDSQCKHAIVITVNSFRGRPYLRRGDWFLNNVEFWSIYERVCRCNERWTCLGSTLDRCIHIMSMFKKQHNVAKFQAHF